MLFLYIFVAQCVFRVFIQMTFDREFRMIVLDFLRDVGVEKLSDEVEKLERHCEEERLEELMETVKRQMFWYAKSDRLDLQMGYAMIYLRCVALNPKQKSDPVVDVIIEHTKKGVEIKNKLRC